MDETAQTREPVAPTTPPRLRRASGRRLWRAPLVAVATAVLLGVGSGTAWAYLTATGTGTGTATVHFTAESSTTSLTLSTHSITHGSDTTVSVTVTVTGLSADGYPKKGAVTVETRAGATACTLSLASSSADAATFSCTITSTDLTVGTYELTAHYTGGQSSDTSYYYDSSTSHTEVLSVST